MARSDLAPEGHKFTEVHFMAATQHRHLCHGQREGMITDAKGLLIAGIQTAMVMNERVMNRMEWKHRQTDEIVIHQVSAMNTQKLVEALEMDATKLHLTFPHYGNVGPAAIPISLCKSLEMGRVSKGDRVVIMGMGSGINCCFMEVLW